MTARAPFVSIIIVNYNGKELLKPCLDSLLRINYPKKDFEIIIVDNGSKDGSLEFIGSNYKNVKTIESKLNNYCYACNLGIKESGGEYIVLLNNDVKVTEDWLAELVKGARKDDLIGASTSKLLREDGTIQNAGLYEMPNFYWDERGAGKESSDYTLESEVDAVSGACVLYRRKALDDTGLLDEDFVMFGEDVDMSLRLKKKGWKLTFIPSSVAYHKLHGSCDESFARRSIEKNRLLLIAKHFPDKLSNSLLGNGYFVFDKGSKESGRIFDLAPELILKLAKEHDEQGALRVTEEVLSELKKIANYDNKKLEDDLKGILGDLIETKKDRDSHVKDKETLKEELSKLSRELKDHKEELQILANKLKESLDSGLLKDSNIREKESFINDLKRQLDDYSGEINLLSGKLRDSLDQGLSKDRNISDLKEQLNDHKGEIVNLSNKLRENMDIRLGLEKTLGDIYNSKGFRFVLKPLWKLIIFGRLTIRRLKRFVSNLIWAAATIVLIPVILIQISFFLIERIMEELFCVLLVGSRKKRQVVAFDKLTVSVVIPNWNGIDLLKKCLSSIYEIDDFREGRHEVLVVDDSSSYMVADRIKDEFPKVRVVRNTDNQGFGRSCNIGVRQARGELIVLLNNDIIVTKDFLGPLKEHFKDSDVFAVAPKLYGWDKKTFNYGMHMGRFERGYINLWNESETGNGDKVAETSPTVFAVGGAMAVRKKDFLWLGGFDDIYRPNCWEDIDISYRAQQRGLKVLYEPKSLVYHKGGATLNYARRKEIKNELLFTWKNIRDDRMLVSHFVNLPRYFFRGKHSSRINFLRGYLWAFNYLTASLANRFRERGYFKVSDKRVLGKCLLYYRNLKRNSYVPREKATILLITPFILYPLNCGGKIRIYNLYKRLSKKYSLILLSLIHNEEEQDYIPSLKEVFNEVYTVHTKTIPNELLFPKSYRFSFSSHLIEKLKEIQDKEPVDIVHIESNEMLYLTKYVKYAPVVYTEHDISILSYLNSYYNKGFYDSISKFVDYLKLILSHKISYRGIEHVVVLSKEDEKVVKAFSPHTGYSLIPTGVDLEHFKFIEKTGSKKSLIFIGHYPHYPNEEAVVYFCRHIFPLIKKVIPEVTLKLVGSCPTEEVLKLSRIKGVEVVGGVEDVNPYLQEASCFVTAFRRSSGIKGKVLEAMATGTPVVSTTRGAFGINAVNGEHIFIADEPSDFAGHVIELLTNEQLYKRIAGNARKLAEEKYDWDKITLQLDSLYKKITQDSSEENSAVVSEDRASIDKIVGRIDKIINLSLGYLSKQGDAEIVQDPQELHVELTHSCNSRCITCDIWDYHKRNNKGINDELGLDEIEGIVRSKHLKEVKTVVLSGGEPFLRKDIADICSLINKTLPKASIGILTNGLETEKILSKTKEILNILSGSSLWIGSSLDGLGEAYDLMRGTTGGFTRFASTVSRFKEELPEVRLSATFVITPLNMGQLIPAWEFAQEHGLDFFAQFGVRKPARSPELFKWDDRDIAKIKGYISCIIRRLITKDSDLGAFNASLSSASDKINLLTKIYYWSHLVDFQQTKKRFSYRCDAGFKFAMFDPYGNLFFCPLLKENIIGNIRESDFDDLWLSGQAQKVRDIIGDGKCSCWLVCTVFPAIDKALALYGDKAAGAIPLSSKPDSNVAETVDVRVIPENRNIDSGLNSTELRDKKTILASDPQGITIGANYKCNADCMFCLGGEYKPFSLQLYRDYFEPKLGVLLNHTSHVSFCGMGELLSTPDIGEFLDYINTSLPNKNKILTTNGLALNENVLANVMKSKYSIQISLHASNPVLHAQLTGLKGGFDKIIDQIRCLVSKRKDRQSPYIVLVFLINTMNIEDLPNFVELASSLGVDCVQCNYLTIFKNSHLKLSCFFKQKLTNEMVKKAMRKAQDLNIPLSAPPLFSQNGDGYFKVICSEPWRNIYVDTHGAVLPCCYSGGHFGELQEDSISAIWNNAKYQQLREGLLSGSSEGICKYCLNNNPANVNILNSHVSFRSEVQKEIFK